MMQWILTSCLLIVAVLLLRKVGGNRLSARARYALWLVVLVRLLVPFSFGQSPMSVMNYVPSAPATQTGEDIYYLPDASDAVDAIAPDGDGTVKVEVSATPVETHEGSVAEALDILWFAGFGVIGAILLSCNLRLDGALKRSRRQVQAEDCTMPVYETAVVETPCMFGLVRPAIYITPELTEDAPALRHVLAHEQTHRRHLDHIWSLLRCVCLAVHWYNPLVWVAAYLSREDAELACDEGALKRIGDEERTAYGDTLIALTCTGHSGLMTTATTMTGSHRGLTERIRRIADRRKASLIVLGLVLILTVLAALALLTGQTPERGVEGVWRTPTTVLGIGQEDNDQTDNWLEYEFSDGTGRETHIVSGAIRYEAAFLYTVDGDRLTLQYEDGRLIERFTWSREGDRLTLTHEESNRTIPLTRYDGGAEEGVYQTTVEHDGNELVSILTLSEGRYVLSEPVYSSHFNTGLYTVDGDTITCTEYGDGYTYRFRCKGSSLVYVGEGSDPIYAHGTIDKVTVTNRCEIPDGGVYKWVGDIPRVVSNPETPEHALMGVHVTTPGLYMGLSRGTDPMQVTYKHTYDNVGQAVNAEHFLEYGLKAYTWELTEREAVVYDEPRATVMLMGDGWSITAAENDNYVLFTTDNGSGWYLANTGENFEVYKILRSWYDELEYLDVLQTPVIINMGQTPNEAAQSYMSRFEEAYLQVSTGSKYRMTYVQSTVVEGDFVTRQTEQMRKNGTLGENEYCFYAEIVFVPETEYALGHSMAGNTVECTDPSAPKGAFERTVCGIISLEDDGWHARIVGTSW